MNNEKIIIFGHTFECENVPYESVKPVKRIPTRDLICSCCGQCTLGRQWYNRDTGYGLCNKCANIISKKYDKEEMKSCYGEKGFHYLLEKKVGEGV